MKRRQFLKSIGLMAAGTALSPLKATAGMFDSILGSTVAGFGTILANSYFNELELEYKMAAPTPSFKCVVSHYLPIAFLEVINAPTDSILVGGKTMAAATQGSLLGSQVIEQDGAIQLNNVRIWSLPEILRFEMLIPLCKYCNDDSTYIVPEQMLSVAASTSTLAACGVESLLGGALGVIQDSIMNQLDFGCVPEIFYDSSFDPLWQTGCHDLATTTALAAASGTGYETMCQTGTASIVGSVLGSFGLPGGDSVNPCVGTWGTLYPRSSSANESSPALAAALTAYRALHLAAYTHGSFPMFVGLGGKMKMVYPVSSGTPMRIGDPIVGAILKELPSFEDTNYGFIYLAPATCLKNYWTLVGACVPMPPCMGGDTAN